MPSSVAHMERDILDAAHTLGWLGYYNGEHAPASKRLYERYTSEDDKQALTAVLNYLVEQRFLDPMFNSSGDELRNGYARGITPKGAERLRELKHPVRYWASKNWFPVCISIITATVGAGSIIANVIVKASAC